jgi:hypothetical protein
MMRHIYFRGPGWAILAIASLLFVARARADMLELTNGDHYSGTIVAMDATNIQFRSEIQGLLTIPRTKIAAISLRSPANVAAPGAGASDPAGVTSAVISQLSSPPQMPLPRPAARTGPGPDAVISQLKQQGPDAGMMNQIQQQVFGQSSPEATEMFNNMIAGLASGTITVDNIRAQARDAIGQIEEAKKDLGGDSDTGSLLDGYAAILQRFVDEAPAPTANPAAKPNPDPTLPPVN